MLFYVIGPEAMSNYHHGHKSAHASAHNYETGVKCVPLAAECLSIWSRVEIIPLSGDLRPGDCEITCRETVNEQEGKI